MRLYEELKGWQGAIGSLFGFVALMIGALWNFQLNRRRDSALRAEEALSVAAALYGEIVLLRKEAARLADAVARTCLDNHWSNLNAVTKLDHHFLAAHTLPDPLLYRALSAKIGLLTPDLTIAITEFHRNFEKARFWLPLFLEDSERSYSYSPTVVLQPACDAVRDVLPALRQIEAMAKMPKRAEDLDLGCTDAVIETEEQSYNDPSSNS